MVMSSLARGEWIEASVGCTMKGTSRGSSLAKGSGLKRTNQGRRSLCPHTSSLVRGKNEYNVDNCKRKAPALSRDFVYYLREEKPTASPPL